MAALLLLPAAYVHLCTREKVGCLRRQLPQAKLHMAVSADSQHEAALMALREVPAACTTLFETFCMSQCTAVAMLRMQMLSVTMSSRCPTGARKAPC